MSSKNSKKSVSLVLGSGGARGLAHIGIIRWLEENGFEIKSISGCSMGALVGGIYAAGKLDEFERWITSVTKIDIVKLLDISWDRSGLIRGDKIIDTLTDLVGDELIEDLSIPFTAVASDIDSQKEVWINSGRLFDAIRASISLPLFLTPFNYRGVNLIDGGVLNPVPIAPTFFDKTDMTIAVNLGGEIEMEPESIDSSSQPTSGDKVISQKIKIFTKHIEKFTQIGGNLDLGVYDIANNAFDAMQGTIARQKLAAYPPDHTIEIAMNACGTLEFDRAVEMIDLGHKKAEKCLRNIIK